ncbi:calexcitin-2-like isoform X2 [Pomacea canaliculata]|uniref:calexcitin-2-like isoform X2 n=1 Tax=Pomacea canaliculata TaxID=400727 RepID=UPI000D72A08D|nr:calexcitin-2-like isoform X2 [Pomacea canaliculata]
MCRYVRIRGASSNKRMGLFVSVPDLSEFQKRKLLHEFTTFFDINKDGVLEWKDFDMARQRICHLSGWKEGSEKFIKTQELFIEIWRRLQDEGDKNLDGRISAEEWLSMWQKFHRENVAEQKNKVDTENKIPDWLQRYVEYKFNLYDRTGDGVIDTEEFEYVLSDFGVSSKDARTCYLLFSNNHEKKVDLDYFKTLSAEYYRSDDPSALGNFITGKLDFEQGKSQATNKN